MNLNYLEETIRTSKYLVCLAGMEFMRGKMSHIIETATNPIGLKKSMATLRKNYSVPVCFNTHAELFYEYYRNEILSKHLEAGKGNEALARLEEAGYLKTIITKGIYNMFRKPAVKM